jgi:7,8-dihydro-6-hydroxymethylpterin-pyrophosphokinase
LSVPHPRFRERRFVLEPLVEIASDLRDPVTGCTVAELLLDLIARGQVS